MNGANITDLKHQVSEEQTFFLTLVEPYNNVDDLFFSLFKAFPLAVVPTEPEALIEFKSKLEELLNFAEMQDVDVLVQDRNAYQSFRVKTLEDFDYATQYVEHTDKEMTPELPDMGNFWSIANEPFEVNFNAVYDNILDPIDQRFTARGDLLPQGQIDLPNSTFDQRHHLGTNNQSELRIVDRLSKYGESFPFLNENGQLSDSARAEFEELLMSEATDEDLLAFLDKGIDAVKGAGSLVGAGLEKVGDMLGVTDKGRERKKEKEDRKYELKKRAEEDKEREEERNEKKIEKAEEKAEKAERLKIEQNRAKENLADAKADLKDVDVEKAAKAAVEGKKNDPALVDKNNAVSKANQAIDKAVEVNVNYKPVSKEKGEVNAKFKEKVKEIKKDSE